MQILLNETDLKEIINDLQLIKLNSGIIKKNMTEEEIKSYSKAVSNYCNNVAEKLKIKTV